MSLITGTKLPSKCMYCGNESYGTGCPYSPHKYHVHVDDSKRCIYCSSTLFGTGCPYNPFNKRHVHGTEYNQMIKDSIHKNITAGLLISKLTEPFNESLAFKYGIINENGVKIKEPETLEEKAAYNPTTQMIFKLKRLISEDVLELFNSTVWIQILSEQNQEFNPKLYEIELEQKNKIQRVAQDLKSIIIDGVERGINLSTLETYIIEAFLHDNKN